MNDRTNKQTDAEALDLRHYIKEINKMGSGGFLLTDDLDHWAEYGIFTKAQLGDYLDDCVAREQMKYDSTESNDDDYDRTMPECDDDPYYRECRAATSGDDMSKADYMDMYSL